MTNDHSNPERRRQKLDASLRLKKPEEFKRVYSERLSVADDRLVVYARRNNLGCPRVGLSVGRRLGGAVQRNRHKRTLREAFRLSRHDLPAGFDYVLIPRRPGSASTRLYGQSLVHLCRKLQRRSQRKRQSQ